MSRGQLLLTVEGVARYWVRGGREILVCPERGAPESSVLLILTGSAVGALLYQRGLLPLHASAVCIAGGCVAFVGPRGAGKSTLAADLHARGHPVLCDDILPIETPAQGRAHAWPGFSRLKLCPDALRLLDVPTVTQRPVGDPQRKRELKLHQAPVERALPVRRIYFLRSPDRDKAVAIHPAHRAERLTILLGHTYRSEFLEGLGLLEQHFRACAMTLQSTSIRCLTAASGLSRLDETIECLEEDFANLERPPAQRGPVRRGARS